MRIKPQEKRLKNGIKIKKLKWKQVSNNILKNFRTAKLWTRSRLLGALYTRGCFKQEVWGS